jgi:hypothetical protein
LRSGVDDRPAQGNDLAACGCVEYLDEGYQDGVEAGEQAEVSADDTAAPVTDHVAEVSPGEEEEGDPEEKKDAPDGLAGAEGDDPEEEGEDTPHQQGDGHGGGGRSSEPAGSDGPLEEGKPPPEEAVGGEGDHAEGVAGLELQHTGDELGDPSVGKGQRDDDGDRLGREQTGVDATENNRGEPKAGQTERGWVGDFGRSEGRIDLVCHRCLLAPVWVFVDGHMRRAPILDHFFCPFPDGDLFVVFAFVFVRDEGEDGAGLGEVEAFGGGLDIEDYICGVGLGAEAGGVHGGELEAVEEGCGALGLEVAGGQGVDDDGEGDLDGFAVSKNGELDVLTGDEVASRGWSVAEAAVTLVEAGVVVAPLVVGQGWGAALNSVGSDVAA